MPQIALKISDVGGRTLPASAGGTAYLPQHRLRSWVRLGGELLPREAVVDTGAPACIFSKRVWEKFHSRGAIVWVAHPPTEAGRATLPRVDVHGGNYPFRLGRIRLQLVDLDKNQLAPRDVLVICTEDVPIGPGNGPPELPRLVLVGLADVMHGRTLRVEASADGQRWAATLSEP